MPAADNPANFAIVGMSLQDALDAFHRLIVWNAGLGGVTQPAIDEMNFPLGLFESVVQNELQNLLRSAPCFIGKALKAGLICLGNDGEVRHDFPVYSDNV